MKLEFEKGLSLDEIKAEMCYYRGNGHTVMCEINGEEVFSDDPEFHEIFERLKLGMSKEQFENYKKTKSEINKLEGCIGTAGSIENYAYYKFSNMDEYASEEAYEQAVKLFEKAPFDGLVEEQRKLLDFLKNYRFIDKN